MSSYREFHGKGEVKKNDVLFAVSLGCSREYKSDGDASGIGGRDFRRAR